MIVVFFICHLLLECYEEARLALPRIEQGLPILDPDTMGRGQREKRKVNKRLPGEKSTTEKESEEEYQSKSKKLMVTKRKLPVVFDFEGPPPPPSSLQSSKAKKISNISGGSNVKQQIETFNESGKTFNSIHSTYSIYSICSIN